MKRIELTTGEMQRGFWDGEKFIFEFKSKVGSQSYVYSDEEINDQYKKATAFHLSSDGNPEDVEIWDFATGQEVISFKTEDPDTVLANSDAKEFFIYMETNNGELFMCTGGEGIKRHAIPTLQVKPIGDYKIFNREQLKQEYLSAMHDFQTLYKRKGFIKLHILPSPGEQQMG